ncbi:polysaccharide deacetylase family protein [Rubrivivax rivuli]|uniref:Polysaccharide deacetylase family protein n=1 Tax=Rubrivivax rivuli TaxID=1862385 RepID=A0A437RT22_9BURK|nr:polysaccharide deacetylase family protein [Rubrivivax rivuli]
MLRAALGRLAPAGPQGRLSIAIFHRVHAQPDPLFPDEPDRQRFDEICRWLKTWFQVLPLDEAVHALREGRLPARALCITFDDGYADNHDHALPVLQAHGLSGAFFIATGFINGGRMWNDTVVETVRRCPQSQLDVTGLGLDGLQTLALGTIEQRRHALHSVLNAAKYLAPARRSEVVEALARRAGVSLPDDLMMNTAQVQAMAAGGMVLGAHTVNHPILAGLDDETARYEMAASRAQLQQWLQREVTLFAYPNGKPGRDYLPRDAALAQSLGFEAAVSTHPGANGAQAPLFELRRFTPWDRQRWRWGTRLAMNLRT